MDRQYDARQHAMLYFASRTDISYWNEWRDSHQSEKILLQEANLRKMNLSEANLGKAILINSDLRKSSLQGANLQKADLTFASLQKAKLDYANMQRAFLWKANLQKIKSNHVNLQRAILCGANLQMTYLSDSNLQRADLSRVRMQKAEFFVTKMQKTEATFSIVDGETILGGCEIDKNTDFTGVGLAAARIDPRLKTALENNIRRKQWKAWEQEGPRWQKFLKFITVKPFWAISNYGASTLRIAICFFALSIIFAGIYYGWGLWDYYGNGIPYNPGIIDKLFTWGFHPNYLHPKIMIRALYFSIVTMTTLGFGDMHANETCWWGHILLMCQVILGYILLGALVTRFAVLFSGTGPAQRYEKDSQALGENDL